MPRPPSGMSSSGVPPRRASLARASTPGTTGSIWTASMGPAAALPRTRRSRSWAREPTASFVSAPHFCRLFVVSALRFSFSLSSSFSLPLGSLSPCFPPLHYLPIHFGGRRGPRPRVGSAGGAEESADGAGEGRPAYHHHTRCAAVPPKIISSLLLVSPPTAFSAVSVCNLSPDFRPPPPLTFSVAMAEIKVLKSMSHPNVVKLRDVVVGAQTDECVFHPERL